MQDTYRLPSARPVSSVLSDVTLNLMSMSDKTLAVFSDVSLHNLMSKVTKTLDVFSDVNPQSNEYECQSPYLYSVNGPPQSHE